MLNKLIVFIFCLIEIKANLFKEYLKNTIIDIINNTYNESNICEKNIYEKFQKDDVSLNYLINSSSTESNDITSYFSCDEGKNTNFYILTFKPINTTSERINATYDIIYSLYGICIYNDSLNCSDSDIQIYLKKILNKTEILLGKTMKIFNMNSSSSKIKKEEMHIVMIILFSILNISIIIFNIFPVIPQFLFRCFFLRRRISKTNNIDIIIKTVDKLALYNFCKCFSFGENTEYFMCSHVNNKSYGSYGITNDEGLGYIKGVFGISIFMTLFGFVYIQLLSEPYKNYDKQTFEDMFYNPFKAFINLSARYGPRVLFSCSGYIFMFKLSCFLEDQITINIADYSSSYSVNKSSSINKSSKSNMIEEESVLNSSNDFKKNLKKNIILFDAEEGSNNDSSEEKNIKESRKNGGSTITNIDRLTSTNFNQIFKPIKKDPESISFYALFSFYKTQLYKLVLIILTMLFIKYVLFIIFEIFEIPSPSLISFRNNLIDGITFSQIFGRIFQYLNFKVMVSIEETVNYVEMNGDKNMCVVFLFWPIICEIFFYIFTVPIIFISYKLKKNPIYALSIIAGVIILLRFILFAASTGEEKMYSTLFYYAGDYYGLFSNNPIVNYSSFLIGCIFGYFYYLSQRAEDKESLIGSNKTVYFLRYQNNTLYYIINSVIIFIISFFIFFEQIYFNISKWIKGDDFTLYNYLSNTFINYFYLIDNDIFLFIFHYLMLSLFCKNEKFLIKYLSKDMWEISVKIYLSFSLFVNFIIIFIMQKTQTKINIQLFSILYYGILSWCILLFISYLFSIFFEIPFKRISHQILKDNKIIRDKKDKVK